MSVSSESLQQAWQRQALDAPRINLAYLRLRTDALRRRARIRNAFEYVGGIVGVGFTVFCCWGFIRPRPLISLSMLLWALAMVYLAVQWHRRASAQDPADQLGTLDALRFYRQQLVRQRDARRGSWRWWLPPLVPCLVVLFAALFVEVMPTPWVVIGWLAFGLAVGVPLSVAAYESEARVLQKEIDALDSMSSKS